MNNGVYSFKLNVDWKLINLISEIDRFDANWTTIERRERQSLKVLKSIATVRSVGASSRIEGNKMSDDEVDVLLKKIDITKLTDRDSQEVVGYFEVLDIISESYKNISLTENHIKSLHNSLMKYSAKDLLSVHPFQDGNGRLSRLISTLLLLKNGYKWIEYVSFEHEIENRKSEYYQVLRSCQAQRPNEDVTLWMQFFLSCLSNIQTQLMTKLNKSGLEILLSPKEKSIFTIIQNRPNIQSGEISKKLVIPSPTVKRILFELLNKGIIEKQGSGRNVSYTIK